MYTIIDKSFVFSESNDLISHNFYFYTILNKYLHAIFIVVTMVELKQP